MDASLVGDFLSRRKAPRSRGTGVDVAGRGEDSSYSHSAVVSDDGARNGRAGAGRRRTSFPGKLFYRCLATMVNRSTIPCAPK